MSETDESTGGKLNYLRVKRIGDCTRCPLHEKRSNVVFGEGNPDADVMFIGEAPGYNEDKQGRPFVGRAGQLLTAWIERAGLTRPEVYISNVVKCRPEDNRDPREAEIEMCSKFLRVQIALIKPKVIVTLGRFAGNLLSHQTKTAMRVLRSRAWRYEDEVTKMVVPVCPVYHPAWVLRRGSPYDCDETTAAVQDILKAVELGKSGKVPDPLPKEEEPVEAEPIPEIDVMELFGD